MENLQGVARWRYPDGGGSFVATSRFAEDLMVSSRAGTVDDYLSELPPARRDVVAAVRDVVRRHVPDGYRESMYFGMIGWCIPLERYPETYNGQPLGYVALAAQKNHYALYLTCAYQDPAELAWLEEAWRRAGLRLDIGKSCLRFRSLEELPLDAVGEFVARTPPEKLIAQYEAVHAASAGGTAAGRGSSTRPTKKRRATSEREAKTGTPQRTSKQRPAVRKRAR
jgi:hypothetical protein